MLGTMKLRQYATGSRPPREGSSTASASVHRFAVPAHDYLLEPTLIQTIALPATSHVVDVNHRRTNRSPYEEIDTDESLTALDISPDNRSRPRPTGNNIVNT